MRAFLGKEPPRLTFDDGVEVVRMLMAAYQSAEQGRTLEFPPPGLERVRARRGEGNVAALIQGSSRRLP